MANGLIGRVAVAISLSPLLVFYVLDMFSIPYTCSECLGLLEDPVEEGEGVEYSRMRTKWVDTGIVNCCSSEYIT